MEPSHLDGIHINVEMFATNPRTCRAFASRAKLENSRRAIKEEGVWLAKRKRAKASGGHWDTADLQSLEARFCHLAQCLFSGSQRRRMDILRH